MDYFAKFLVIDASSDTLILEGDKDLEYTQLVSQRYYSPDFLILAYTPNESLFSVNTIKNIEIYFFKAIKFRGSYVSYIYIKCSLTFKSSIKNILVVRRYSKFPGKRVKFKISKRRVINSPIYKDSLVSSDFTTTSIIINLKEDNNAIKLRDERNRLRKKQSKNLINESESKKLEIIEKTYRSYKSKSKIQNEETINSIRNIIKPYQKEEVIFLGGLNMITNDVVNFVKNDLKIFGISILLFLVVALMIIFRQLRWVLIPLITCSFSVIITSGILSIFAWDITIISSNFISLQLIFTMAIIVHLTVKYRSYTLTIQICHKKIY